MEFKHIPVLFHEIMDIMAPQPGEVFVDCTLGGGGHSKGFLERISPDGTLIGIDQDTNALAAAQQNLCDYSGRVTYVHSNYSNLDEILNTYAPDGVDGILFDIGVSSHQLDEKDRGFSYMQDAPLDMRMDQSRSMTARDVVNTYSEDELHRIIKEYGEERWAKRIAKFIVEFRSKQPIETTGELVDIIKRAIPKGAREEGSHPAKRTFQAIRIELNKELEVLQNNLDDMIELLNPGGRICIITFHSLEDRIVKTIFKKNENPCTCPSHFPVCVCGKESKGNVVGRKPILPSEEELEVNSRSKSAKLRVFERV